MSQTSSDKKSENFIKKNIFMVSSRKSSLKTMESSLILKSTPHPIRPQSYSKSNSLSKNSSSQEKRPQEQVIRKMSESLVNLKSPRGQHKTSLVFYNELENIIEKPKKVVYKELEISFPFTNVFIEDHIMSLLQVTFFIKDHLNNHTINEVKLTIQHYYIPFILKNNMQDLKFIRILKLISQLSKVKIFQIFNEISAHHLCQSLKKMKNNLNCFKIEMFYFLFRLESRLAPNAFIHIMKGIQSLVNLQSAKIIVYFINFRKQNDLELECFQQLGQSLLYLNKLKKLSLKMQKNQLSYQNDLSGLNTVSKSLIERKEKLEKLSLYIGNFFIKGKNKNVSKKELKFLIKQLNALNYLKDLKIQIGDHDTEESTPINIKIQDLSNLEKLKLHLGRNINLKNNQLKTLADNFSDMKQLKMFQLKLYGNNQFSSDNDFQNFSQTLSQNVQIRKLDIDMQMILISRQNAINNESMIFFSQCIAKLKNLNSLNLNFSTIEGITQRGINDLLRSIINLEDLIDLQILYKLLNAQLTRNVITRIRRIKRFIRKRQLFLLKLTSTLKTCQANKFKYSMTADILGYIRH